MSIRLRNRLLALSCLLVFVAVGYVFFATWVVQKPFAMILFVSDALNASDLTASRIYAGGAQHRFALESFPHLALVSNYANDYSVPDTASATTALSTGKKVNSKSLAIDPAGKKLESILEYAGTQGRSTGLVTNGAIAEAGSGAFYAKTNDSANRAAIAAQLIDVFSPNVILGGGEVDFLPDVKGGTRTDSRDLMLEMRRKGYNIVKTTQELENTAAWQSPNVFAIFAPNTLNFFSEAESSAAQPTLASMVRSAIQFLQYNGKGYLLVVDAGLSGNAARENQSERFLRETQALDQAIATAREYAGKNALIIAVGREAIGGLRLNGYPFRSDKGVAILGANSHGIPSLTWSNGPAPQQLSGQTPAAPAEAGASPAPSPSAAQEVSAVHLDHAIGVAEDVMAIGIGPGSEKINGFLDNTAIYQILKENL
ncbi:MAG: alkaline phosphatase [Chthoniobacterales bacterium]